MITRHHNSPSNNWSDSVRPGMVGGNACGVQFLSALYFIVVPVVSVQVAAGSIEALWKQNKQDQ